ncbi:MAG: GatB/YqeY domain-containing protein [Saprospiraceae bacterium]|nr:GatB/YqeY domain-containing protein [Saprospiraceae bacterium]
MTLEQQISEDLKSAMKAKDQAALRSIRAIKSAILLRKTDGSGKEMDSEDEIKLLQKLVKSRKESLEIYIKQNRSDLAKVEEEEIAVIEKYLPQPMSPEEAEHFVLNIIKEVGASSMKDMGAVMSMAKSKAGGRIDGKLLAQLVRQNLNP